MAPSFVHPNVTELEELCVRGRAAIAANNAVELLEVDTLYGKGVKAKKFKGRLPDDIAKVRSMVADLLETPWPDP